MESLRMMEDKPLANKLRELIEQLNICCHEFESRKWIVQMTVGRNYNGFTNIPRIEFSEVKIYRQKTETEEL